MPDIREKLEQYGYGMFTVDDRLELLLNIARIPDIKTRLKKINQENVKLYDLFARTEKAKTIMSEKELDSISAVRLLVSDYLEEGLYRNSQTLSSPQAVAEFLRVRGQDNLFEEMGVLYLNTKNQLLKYEVVAEGSTDTAVVYPKNILKRAIELNASSILIAHNHPSGNCEPSSDDIRLTSAVKDAAGIIDIKVLDHIIIGHKHGYFSFREKGLIDNTSMRFSKTAAEYRADYKSAGEETESKAQSLFKKVDSKLEGLSRKLDAPETEAEVRSFLKFMSKFHNYSLVNQMLIMFESMLRGTNIEKVASYKFWSDLKNDKNERAFVKKGEKGYSVLVPVTYTIYERNEDGSFKNDENGKKIPKTNPDTGNVMRGLAFKSGAVFDVNQTKAKEIGAWKDLEYRNVAAEFTESGLKELISRIQDKYKVIVREENIAGGANGYYSYQDNLVVLDNKPDKTPAMKLSTLMHELGHHIIHGPEFREKKASYFEMHEARGAREGEAEAFSFALSSMFGVENKSELYIKTWGNDAAELKERLNKIRTAVMSSIETLKIEELIGINSDIALKNDNILLEDVEQHQPELPNLKVAEAPARYSMLDKLKASDINRAPGMKI